MSLKKRVTEVKEELWSLTEATDASQKRGGGKQSKPSSSKPQAGTKSWNKDWNKGWGKYGKT